MGGGQRKARSAMRQVTLPHPPLIISPTHAAFLPRRPSLFLLLQLPFLSRHLFRLMYKRDVAAAKVEVTEECNAGGREESCRWEGGIMQVESRGKGGRGRGRMRKVKGGGGNRWRQRGWWEGWRGACQGWWEDWLREMKGEGKESKEGEGGDKWIGKK